MDIRTQVVQPTLLLNKERAIQNIERMASKARRSHARLRPHFKTHQSAGIGRLFRDQGIEAITVTSVDMAEYFARNGWTDITIAFPVNWRQIESIDRLASRVQLNLLAASKETVTFLARHLTHPVQVWVDVDTGYKRTGVRWDRRDAILEMVNGLRESKHTAFRGLLTHAGHAYHASSKAEMVAVYEDTVSKLFRVRQWLNDQGVARVEISIGDTPGCSVVEDFSGVDEIRPGNFVFYDIMQLDLGACREEDLAVALACPVVAKDEDRRELVLYGGAVHLSKDYLANKQGDNYYGLVALLGPGGWGPILKDSFVSNLTQEVGLVKASEELYHSVEVGDAIAILPVHSCLTVHQMKHYVTLEGEIIEKACL